jgi:hypothetical protein
MSEPIKRTVRRQVITTRRVRREVTVQLSPRRACRLGIRLLLAGLRASGKGRPVALTLRTLPKSTTETEVSEEVVGEPR